MEKNRVLNRTINHSPSLFDAPETEALALRNWQSSSDFESCLLYTYLL